jgi:hypothetical protein
MVRHDLRAESESLDALAPINLLASSDFDLELRSSAVFEERRDRRNLVCHQLGAPANFDDNFGELGLPNTVFGEFGESCKLLPSNVKGGQAAIAMFQHAAQLTLERIPVSPSIDTFTGLWAGVHSGSRLAYSCMDSIFG